jgi:hypothetical protein
MLANRLIVLGGSANRQVAGGSLIICLVAAPLAGHDRRVRQRRPWRLLQSFAVN